MRPCPSSGGVGLGWLAIVLAVLTGCADRDPLDRTVEADSAIAYHQWLNRHGSRLEPADRSEFEAAMKSLQLLVQMKHPGLPPEVMRERHRARIHGKTVRAILGETLLVELRQIAVDQTIDRALLQANAENARSEYTDQAGADHILSGMNRIQQRMDARAGRVGEIERRLTVLFPGRSVKSLDLQFLPPPVPEAKSTPSA